MPYYTIISTFKEDGLMYRKIMSFLEAWRENEHRKPLILQGGQGRLERLILFWSLDAPAMKM